MWIALDTPIHAYKVNKDDGENAGKDINLAFMIVLLTV